MISPFRESCFASPRRADTESQERGRGSRDGMKNLFKRSGNAPSAPTSSGQTIAAALAKATSNTVQPLQQQEMLFLLGASVREPPAMAAAWLDRIISIGKQAEAVLKMLTVLHRLQACIPPQEPAAPTTPPLHTR